ncbi:class I SAM-dependent methyltransferase [Pseudomonas sp. O230]|uniref:class I SAM-dependent methyltransferase n=1 Tax=Pseudomonas sp. O230 TaxID=3159450 RepID=UPI00387B1DB5
MVLSKRIQKKYTLGSVVSDEIESYWHRNEHNPRASFGGSLRYPGDDSDTLPLVKSRYFRCLSCAKQNWVAKLHHVQLSLIQVTPRMTSTRQPFPSESFDLLAAEEAKHWWFRARNRVILWAMRKYVGPFNRFLEVGCGTAFVLDGVNKAYPHSNLYGSEYFEEGLVHARKRIPNATFLQIDATVMKDVSQYDVIGAFDVIEHIEQDQLALNNLARALESGGTLLITVPQHQWLWSEVDEFACHVRRYSRPELIQKVESAGLSVKYTSSFVSLLVPLMWLSRARPSKGDYDPMTEFHIPKFINKSLELVMRFELTLMKLGLRLPLGGSLLLVAKKP